MDLSDGLGADLPRLAKASRVGFEVEESAIRAIAIAQLGRRFMMVKITSYCSRSHPAMRRGYRQVGEKTSQGSPDAHWSNYSANCQARSQISRLCSFQIASKKRFLSGEARGAISRWRYSCLTGDFGAGKTQFVKGLVAGLGSAADVTSPTFTLLHEYSTADCRCITSTFIGSKIATQALH